MKRKILLIALLIVAMASCKKSDTSSNPTPTPAASIIGNWHDDGSSGSSGSTLVFNANNTYSLSVAGNEMDGGTYTISSTKVTLKTTSSLFCTVNASCNYTFSVTATTLKFTYMNDGCSQRFPFFNLTYTRQ